MIKLIIYDLDGTLINSSKDISNSVNWALGELGFPALSEALIRTHVGNGVIPLIKQVLHEVSASQDLLERALQLYKSRYSDHLLDETKLYPEVEMVLKFFKDRKQAIITNKTATFSRRILKGLGVDSYFFEVIGGDQALPKKPAPDSVLSLMTKTGAGRGETVFIGDSNVDIQTAKNAGIKSIIVTYGFESLSSIQSQKPDFIVDRLGAVLNLDLMK